MVTQPKADVNKTLTNQYPEMTMNTGVFFWIGVSRNQTCFLQGEGGALLVVSKMLGHADIATTGDYLHMSRARIREQYDRFHPKHNPS